MSSTAFRYLHHLVTVPVVVNRSTEARFVLDTGIGLTLFSESLCDEIGCEPNGSTFVGRRMSGQEVTVPLASAPTLSMGSATRDDLAVGVFDMSGFPDEFAWIDGFLSLAFFATSPFTVDYPKQVVVMESATSLSERLADGYSVDVRVRQHGPAFDVFLPLTVPGRRTIAVEVDMGSDSLILDESLAGDVGVRLRDPAVRRVEGQDETGNFYTRYFTQLRGAIHPADAPAVTQTNPDVMFQNIIYDGLVGDSFLGNFAVTYDLANSRMIFARRPSDAPSAGRLWAATPPGRRFQAAAGRAPHRARPRVAAVPARGRVAAIVAVLGLSSSSQAGLLAEIDRLGTNLLTVTNGQTFFGEPAELPLAAPGMIARIGPVTQVQETGSTDASVYRSAPRQARSPPSSPCSPRPPIPKPPTRSKSASLPPRSLPAPKRAQQPLPRARRRLAPGRCGRGRQHHADRRLGAPLRDRAAPLARRDRWPAPSHPRCPPVPTEALRTV